MPINFQFDVRTVALFVAMTFFVQATAIGAQAFLIRDLKQYRGVGTVLTANLCVALGLLLRLFSDRLPEFLTTVVSNTLVQAGPILRALVDRGLVRVAGRADVPGHPLQYGTGKEFLDRFGLMGLEELPRDAELARG